MSDHERIVGEWMDRNRNRMVQCHYQPGNLLITRQSCLARRQRAKEEDLTDIMKGDVLDYVYRKGLAICLACEESELSQAGSRRAALRVINGVPYPVREPEREPETLAPAGEIRKALNAR